MGSGAPDDCDNRGGIAQINIPSLQKTKIAVSVANVYPMNKLKANFNTLERIDHTSTGLFTSTSAEKRVE